MSLDNLERRLERYEARLRETRHSLLMVKHRQAGLPEEIHATAERLLQLSSEADSVAEDLGRMLQAEYDKRTRALRQRQLEAIAKETKTPVLMDFVSRNERTAPPDFGSKKLYGEDEDEAAGNAPVPAFPRRPVPVLAGGAARRFEESDEPPRNP